MKTPERASHWHSTGILQWLCLLLLCSAYLQGSITKAIDFPAAIAEMRHFGLKPEAPLALLTIVGELSASLLILTGYRRWIGAVFLGAFTLSATFIANRFWEAEGALRFGLENAFFEHLGLAGAFFLVALIDFQRPSRPGE